MILFQDDYRIKVFVYFLACINEVIKYFQIFKANVEKESGLQIKSIRSDCGSEYVNKELEEYLNSNGIKYEKCVSYDHEQNGVIERMVRAIVDKAKSTLSDSGLEKHFWQYACAAAVNLKSRSPTRVVLGFTPEEKWSGIKVDLSHLKVFGCIHFVHILKEKKIK